MPSYTAFVMPGLRAERDAAGTITDVAITYPCDLTAQMLQYSEATVEERATMLPHMRTPASGSAESPQP